MTNLSIVFAGTPEFACAALDGLQSSSHDLLAVYTQPDRPKGRGRKLTASPVKQYALDHQLPVYTPTTLKDEASQDTLRQLAPDLLVVVAYGLLLPQAVLDIPRLGCINVHASILPRWRGASPIQQAILHGDETTGISIMKMDAGLDTGPVYEQATCEISPEDTSGSLHDKLAALSVSPLLNTVNALAADPNLTPTVQADELATHAPKISKAQAQIDWTQPAVDIARQIRAFQPWPVAITTASTVPVKIHQAHAQTSTQSNVPGTVLSLGSNGITVATGDGVLCIEKLQTPGGKVLSAHDWLQAPARPIHEGLLLQ